MMARLSHVYVIALLFLCVIGLNNGVLAVKLGEYLREGEAIPLPCPLGHYCVDGQKHACPSGNYGATIGLKSSDCSGLCEEGFYCEAGSTSPRQKSCPLDPRFYCPRGSKGPMRTGLGWFAINNRGTFGGGYGGEKQCTPGYYCIDGLRHSCATGRYGNRMLETNASCTGACSAGWYCPEGSTSMYERSCGDPGVFCPEGSPSPVPVASGYYTVGSSEDMAQFEIGVGMAGYNQGEARTSQRACEEGYFCLGDGIKRKCPRGRFGSRTGEKSPRCTGSCKEGYYCPEGAISETENPCGSIDVFCPPGAFAPHPVQRGYYTVPAANLPYDAIGDVYQAKERKCEPGYYCKEGVKRLCQKGYWGSEYGLYDPQCSGKCSEGYYCPEGSSSPTEVMCGDASVYCTEGSWKPTPVSEGFFSTGGDHSTRTGQAQVQKGSYAIHGIQYKCPAGFYGATVGLSSPECSGKCNKAGFYCNPGSIFPTQHACGSDDKICPAGTVAPIQVLPGFYTVDYSSLSINRSECAPGMWRNSTGLSLDTTIEGGLRSPIMTHESVPPCELCPIGTYKALNGDDPNLCIPCPHQSEDTPSRMLCSCMETFPKSTGMVAFFNLTAGNCSAMHKDILAETAHDGFYLTDPLSSQTRSKQKECEPGYYCMGGLRYPCPPGHYGSKPRESNPTCEGLCSRGYYCHEASSTPYQIPCGNTSVYCPGGSFTPVYASAGYYTDESEQPHLRSRQLPCPKGYYCKGGFHLGGEEADGFDGLRHLCSPGTFADVEMVSVKECSGLCDPGHYCLEGSSDRQQNLCGGPDVYCPRGSALPTKVHDGFYGSHSGINAGTLAQFDTSNDTFSVETPCEPSYYCTGGIKYPCPPGHFGWKFGMQTAECSGLCPAGYYCPSYMDVQPDSPSHTVWPYKPHISGTDHECGENSWFCPKGSSYPTKVRGGYYTVGGDSDGGTRSMEIICPPGSYCINGVKYMCPAKRYGNVEGLSSHECSGWCTPGHYCEVGTADPVPCDPTQFSTGAQDECNPCPSGERKNPLPCQHDRVCCYQGIGEERYAEDY